MSKMFILRLTEGGEQMFTKSLEKDFRVDHLCAAIRSGEIAVTKIVFSKREGFKAFVFDRDSNDWVEKKID